MRRLIVVGIIVAGGTVSAQPVLVWDPTPSHVSGPLLAASIANTGILVNYTTVIDSFGTLAQFRAVFACLGHNEEFILLQASPADFLLTNHIMVERGHVFVEGQTFWTRNPPTFLHNVLGVVFQDTLFGEIDSLFGTGSSHFDSLAVNYLDDEFYHGWIVPSGAHSFPVWEADMITGGRFNVGVGQVIQDSLFPRDIETLTTSFLFGNDTVLAIEERDEVGRIYLDFLIGPTVGVLSPNAGDTYVEGQPLPILLTVSDDVGVDSTVIRFTNDGGATWSHVATLYGEDSTYAWIVPFGSASPDCRIEAQTWDVEGFTWEDKSGTFTVPVREDPRPRIPVAVSLSAAPNPFNPSVVLSFELPEPSVVRLVAYDILGRPVGRIADGPMSAGAHMVRWEPESTSSGVYIVRLTSSAGSANAKVVLVR